ncbi:unnamed protein product [Pelagomonas calceolata]|uniref:Uncharacterized protein n=2 Tax=Pelagomonas calceolata TaxID=35677 RepID=A0A8J2X4M5_9STRA|nr:unnamed protein product [Pelagomonas calceolata]
MAASLIGTTQQAAASIFLEQGVAVVPGAVKEETIAICRAAAAAALACSDAAITNNIRDLDASAPGAHHAAVRLHRRDFAEYLKRDGGRVDLRFNSDAAPFDALLRETRTAVLDVATEALGGSAILYSGVMVARANAGGDHQRWHKDGDHENSESPNALTVFVPLQPLTAANGPTEFRLGSHRPRANDVKRLRQDGVAVMCDAGDALLFDYRIDHRGLANASDEDRLVFFCAFARPSFRDEKNARSTVPLFPETHVALTGDRGETSCVLFELTVDGVGTIRVCEGDVPEAVAVAFCSKHDLPGEAVAPLAAAIEQQMELCKDV